MTEVKRTSLVKPTLDTCFHIDFAWWSKHDRDWHVFLHDYLCQEHQKIFKGIDAEDMVDWVDPVTAEVQRVDGLQHALTTHCAKQEDFVTQQTTLVEAVFRILLANGNQGLTPQELGQIMNRPPITILKTLSGLQVYKGIRPCPE